MRAYLERKNLLFKTKIQTNNQQAVTADIEEMNGINRWKVDGRIIERAKLLIWTENTYKHKIKIKN
jgi:hypothetical protein